MATRYVGPSQQYGNILSALNASANGDVITITGGTLYEEIFNDIALINITINSSRSSPDNFPILRLNLNSNTLNHINNWLFEAVIMEPNVSRLTFNLQNISFARCVFRNYDYLLANDCQAGMVKKFDSCIFHDFSGYVFNARQNFVNEGLVVRNCTFHNCAKIFNDDFNDNLFAECPKINNSIFVNCPNIAPDVSDIPEFQQPGRRHRIFQQFKYCTFANDPQTPNAQLGSGCYVNVNESRIYSYAGAKTIPTHFKIANDPAIRDAGSNALGYTPDVAKITRSSIYDRGAWEYDGSEPPPPPAATVIMPYLNYQAAF